MQSRLYYHDSEIVEFEATVTSQVEKDGKYYVTLSQTAFYPTSGGQTNDVGTIHTAKVLDVTADDVESPIIHVLDGPVPMDVALQCKVDSERRFDHMQQHLAQHILSAVFEKQLDVDTVGFHMGTDIANIDVAIKQLSREQVESIEESANHIIRDNRRVYPQFVDEASLPTIPLRNPPKVAKNIRIVVIDGFDHNACGGTHPKWTGQVGILKIIRVENTPRGVRVHFVAGKRALHDYSARVDVLQALSAKLSSTVFEVPEAVERLQDQLASARKNERDLKETLALMHAKEVVLKQVVSVAEDVSLVHAEFTSMDISDLKTVVKYTREFLATHEGQYVICFHSVRAERLNILVECVHSTHNANLLLQGLLQKFGGKGGGNANAAQGSAPHRVSEEIYPWIRSQLESVMTSGETR